MSRRFVWTRVYSEHYKARVNSLISPLIALTDRARVESRLTAFDVSKKKAQKYEFEFKKI